MRVVNILYGKFYILMLSVCCQGDVQSMHSQAKSHCACTHGSTQRWNRITAIRILVQKGEMGGTKEPGTSKIQQRKCWKFLDKDSVLFLPGNNSPQRQTRPYLQGSQFYPLGQFLSSSESSFTFFFFSVCFLPVEFWKSTLLFILYHLCTFQSNLKISL